MAFRELDLYNTVIEIYGLDCCATRLASICGVVGAVVLFCNRSSNMCVPLHAGVGTLAGYGPVENLVYRSPDNLISTVGKLAKGPN